MTDDILKCSQCEKELDRDVDDFDFSLTGEVFCSDCKYSGEDYASMLVLFLPDGQKNTWKFDKDFVYLADDDDYEELPEPIADEVYVRTDAWRGYTDHKLAEGFVQIEDGWVTGYPDDTVRRKWDVAEFYEKLKRREIVPPKELWWLFAQTSNVFSTATTVICRADDEQEIRDWLTEVGADLHYWLG